MYSVKELRRIHQHFNHCTAQRIYSLMHRSKDYIATPETLTRLEDITRSCNISQRISDQPGSFHVSIYTEDIVFGSGFTYVSAGTIAFLAQLIAGNV